MAQRSGSTHPRKFESTKATPAEAALSRVTRSLIRSHDRERLRVARDLHDDIGQRIAACQFAITRLRSQLEQPGERVVRQFDSLITHAAALSTRLEHLSYSLYPPALRLLGLAAAIEQLCEETSRKRQVAVTFSSRAVPHSVRKPIAECVFRVVEDALAMSTRGRRASGVFVNLRGTTRGGRCLHLHVSDTGNAPNREDPASPRDVRLVTMRERVAAVNGTFSRTWKRGQGAHVFVHIPL